MNSHLLTQREKEIFKMLADELSTKEISKTLGISEKTTRNHISNVIGKLGVQSRTQAILILVKNGMIHI